MRGLGANVTIDLSPVLEDSRRRANRRTGLAERTRAHTTRSWVTDWNLLGVLGEYVFSLATGQPMRKEGKRSVCDGGADWIIGGRRLNVKARRAPSMAFLHPRGDPLRADFYPLTVVNPRRCVGWLLGVATKAMVEAAPEAPAFQAPKHPAVWIPWGDLLPVPAWMLKG
jgi:hypothetical protein